MGTTRASEAIRLWLQDRTQQDLADLIGSRVGRRVRQSTISAIKRGEATPRGDIISALYSELHIEVDWWSETVDPTVPIDPPSGHEMIADDVDFDRAG